MKKKVAAIASAALIILAGLWAPALSEPAAGAAAAVTPKSPSPARLPDGKPNWTGFWVPPGGLMDVYRGPSGLDGAPIGANSGLVKDPTLPAMKSPYKEQYEESLKELAKGRPVPDKVALCYPPGMPGMMGMIYGMEILQTPNIIAITSEWQAASRRIWMDLKKHPPAEELDDTYTGHSIGHWEGDVLVVDTVGLRADVPFQHQVPYLHSNKTRIAERFHQIAPDTLVDEVTVTDPEVFVKPWVKTFTYKYKPNLRLEEYVCLDNNRNVDAEGRQKF
jgi:hypothetical protein